MQSTPEELDAFVHAFGLLRNILDQDCEHPLPEGVHELPEDDQYMLAAHGSLDATEKKAVKRFRGLLSMAVLSKIDMNLYKDGDFGKFTYKPNSLIAALKQHFSKQVPMQHVGALTDLVNCRQGPSESPQDYLDRFNVCLLALNRHTDRQRLDDDTLRDLLLQGLHARHVALYQACLQNQKLTLAGVKQDIRSLKEAEPFPAADAMHLVGRPTGGAAPQHCLHWANFDRCTQSNGKPCHRLHLPERKGVLVCWNCGEPGHVKEVCSKPKTKSGRSVLFYQPTPSTTPPEDAAVVGPILSLHHALGPDCQLVLDTGSVRHCTGTVRSLIEPRPCNVRLQVGDGRIVVATQTGTLRLRHPRLGTDLLLPDVLYLPECPHTLLSVFLLQSHPSHWVALGDPINTAQIRSRSTNLPLFHGAADPSSRLFVMDLMQIPPAPPPCLAIVPADGPSMTAAELLDAHVLSGHQNWPDLLPALGLSSSTTVPTCISCIASRSRLKSLPADGASRATDPLERLHMDFVFSSHGNKVLGLLLVDDFSRFSALLPLVTKAQSPWLFGAWYGQEKHRLKPNECIVLQSDDEQIFHGANWTQQRVKHGITPRFSAPHRQGQNGVVERKVNTIQDKARALVLHATRDNDSYSNAEIPDDLWIYAMMHAVQIVNDLPTNANPGRATPNSLFKVTPSPLLHTLPLFSHVLAHEYKRHGKPAPKARSSLYLGISPHHKRTAVVFDLSGHRTVHKLYNTHDVDLVKGDFPLRTTKINFSSRASPFPALSHLSRSALQAFYSGGMASAPISPPAVAAPVPAPADDADDFSSLASTPPSSPSQSLGDGPSSDEDSFSAANESAEDGGSSVVDVSSDLDAAADALPTIDRPPAGAPVVGAKTTALWPADRYRHQSSVQRYKCTILNYPSSTTVRVRYGDGVSATIGIDNVLQPSPPAAPLPLAFSINQLPTPPSPPQTPIPPPPSPSPPSPGLQPSSLANLNDSPPSSPSDSLLAVTSAGVSGMFGWSPPPLRPASFDRFRNATTPLAPADQSYYAAFMGLLRSDDYIDTLPDPKTRRQMLASANAEAFLADERAEIADMFDKKVFSIVPRSDVPRGHTIYRGKWVYKIKRDASGNPARCKARYVAQQFTKQAVQGRDYHASYASTADWTTVKLVLALVNYHDLDLCSFDLSRFFLHGDMEEGVSIFLEQPDGHSMDKSNYVLKLNKTLYGTVSAARQAKRKLEAVLCGPAGPFHKVPSDDSLLVCRQGSAMLILPIHVDDFLGGGNQEGIQLALATLGSEFSVTHIPDPEMYTGTQISRDRARRILKIHQTRDCTKLVAESGFLDCNPRPVPFPLNYNPQITTLADAAAQQRYAHITGMLIWLLRSRIDLAKVTNFLCSHTTAPTTEHVRVADEALRYLSGSLTDGIVFDASSVEGPLQPTGWSDASFAGLADGTKSTGGYFVQYAGGTIEARSMTLQPGTSTSVNEAETRAARECATACMWTNEALGDMGFPVNYPMVIHADNAGQVKNTVEMAQNKASRHYRIVKDSLRNICEQNYVKFKHVPSTENPADMLTKPLAPPVFRKHKRHIMGDQTLLS